VGNSGEEKSLQAVRGEKKNQTQKEWPFFSTGCGVRGKDMGTNKPRQEYLLWEKEKKKNE